MDDDQFTKLLNYIADFRSEVNQRMDDFDHKINSLTNTLDKFM